MMARAHDAELAILQGHFDALVRVRAGEFIGEILARGLALPELVRDDAAQCWLPVPGMFGGFVFRLGLDSEALAVFVESGSRVVTGSGQCHVVTRDGARLLESGRAWSS